jgi:hypothetical protein
VVEVVESAWPGTPWVVAGEVAARSLRHDLEAAEEREQKLVTVFLAG